MSKMDDMRAMREANFAAAPLRAPRATRPADDVPVAPLAPKRTPANKTPVKKDPGPKAPKPTTATTGPTTAPSSAGDDSRRCGHRAISGRSCTREHGHEEKSHRYG